MGHQQEGECQELIPTPQKVKDNELNQSGDEQDDFSKFSRMKELLIILYLLLLLFLGTAVDMLLMPFFPTEAFKRGVGETRVGIIFASFDLANFFFHLFPLPCMTAFTEGNVLFAVCIALRMVGGFASATLTIASASISLKSKSFLRPTMISWVEMSIALGYMSASFIGGLLFELLGYTFTFVIFGGIILLSSIPIWGVIPNIKDVNEESQGMSRLLCVPGVMMMFVGILVSELTQVGLLAMLSPWLMETYDMRVWEASMVMGFGSVAYIIANPISAALTNKGVIYSQIMVAFGCAVLCFFFVTPSPILMSLMPGFGNRWMTFILVPICVMTQAFVSVPLFQAGLDSADVAGHDTESVQTFALLVGVISSGTAFGSMLGSPLSGAITEHLSYEWFTTITSFINGLMLVIFALFCCSLRIKGVPFKPQSISYEQH